MSVGEAIRSLYAVVPELMLVKSLAPLDADEFETLGNMEIQQCERMGKEATEILATLRFRAEDTFDDELHGCADIALGSTRPLTP